MNLQKQLPRKWAIGLAFAVVYLPYAWLLLLNTSWDSYRWYWIKLWPILPGVTPTFLLRMKFQGLSGWPFFCLMFLFTMIFVAPLLYCALRSKRKVSLPILFFAVLLSCFCSFGAYGLFRS